jgi:hypothetical protein
MADGSRQSINDYLHRGGTITHCPAIETPQDRSAVNSHRPQRPLQPQNDVKPLSEGMCKACIKDKGKNTKRCLKCPHYRQLQKEYDNREQIAFDHLPEIIIEQVAALPQPDVIERIKHLPLEMSVPLMMQYYLGATLSEIGKYLKISKQAVDARNKKTLTELRTLLRS